MNKYKVVIMSSKDPLFHEEKTVEAARFFVKDEILFFSQNPSNSVNADSYFLAVKQWESVEKIDS